MIIEQNGIALELDGSPLRLYGTHEEFKNLASQSLEAARKVAVGWVDINPADKVHHVTIKPQDPPVQKWVSEKVKA
jgi:hypothetical protein